MAWAKKICPEPGCPNVMGDCEAHDRKPWQGSTRRTELPGDWERRRRIVLERDPVCTECWAAVSQEVHHRGDKHDHRISELAGVCLDCHRDLTAAQSREARRNTAERGI